MRHVTSNDIIYISNHGIFICHHLFAKKQQKTWHNFTQNKEGGGEHTIHLFSYLFTRIFIDGNESCR